MKIKIHSILSLKEVLGGRDVEMIVPDGTTVSGLLAGMIEIWGDSLSPIFLNKEVINSFLMLSHDQWSDHTIPSWNGDDSQRRRRGLITSSCGRGVKTRC